MAACSGFQDEMSWNLSNFGGCTDTEKPT